MDEIKHNAGIPVIDMQAVRSGDHKATVAFLTQYKDVVLQAAMERQPDERLAREAARDVLREAVTQLRQGQRIADVEAWLVQLTYRYTPEPQRTLAPETAVMPVAQADLCATVALHEDAEDAPCHPNRKERRQPRRAASKERANPLMTVAICAVSLLLVILLWAMLGVIAKNLHWNLPDLGYYWFNNHVLYLF